MRNKRMQLEELQLSEEMSLSIERGGGTVPRGRTRFRWKDG